MIPHLFDGLRTCAVVGNAQIPLPRRQGNALVTFCCVEDQQNISSGIIQSIGLNVKHADLRMAAFHRDEMGKHIIGSLHPQGRVGFSESDETLIISEGLLLLGSAQIIPL